MTEADREREAVRIIRKLDPMLKQRLRLGNWNVSQYAARLMELGLLRHCGGYKIELTDLGLAVRNHLTEGASNG